MRHLPLASDALAATLGDWKTRWPGLGLVALLPEGEKAQLPLLQRVCRELGVPVVGGIFPALVTPEGFRSDGVWLMPLPDMPPHVLLSPLSLDARVDGQRVADAVTALLPGADSAAPKPTLYLLFDGLLPHIASLLEELYLQLSNRVDYAGVNAGSETFQPMPCLFDGDRVVGQAVLGLLLPGGAATILEHGYPAPRHVMTATATVGNRVLSIDWRPAFDTYQEILRNEHGIELTRENFYEHACHFPLAILRATDEVVVRIPVALAEDGSVYCVGEVPENAMLVLLRAPAAEACHCIAQLAAGLQQANGALQGRPLLTFYCAGRRMHLGEAAEAELSDLYRRTGASCMGGAVSLGEIGSTNAWGYPMFHNATLVCTPWPGS